MPARKPRKGVTKKAKKAAKKAPRGATPKKVAPRRSYTKPGLNQEFLTNDIAYYEENVSKGRPRTPPTPEYPKGVLLSGLHYEEQRHLSKDQYGRNMYVKTGYYVSDDGKVRITEAQYTLLSNNPNAVPRYVPIKDKNGKIVKYYSAQTKQLVTPYYRNKVFGSHFRNRFLQVGEENEGYEEALAMANAYEKAQIRYRSVLNKRSRDLMYSYAEAHPEFKDENGVIRTRELLSNPAFQQNVLDLQRYNSLSQYGFDPYNVAKADVALGGKASAEQVRADMEAVQAMVNLDPAYWQLLVDLGRRVPNDRRPVDSYKNTGYYENLARPYFKARAEGDTATMLRIEAEVDALNKAWDEEVNAVEIELDEEEG